MVVVVAVTVGGVEVKAGVEMEGEVEVGRAGGMGHVPKVKRD